MASSVTIVRREGESIAGKIDLDTSGLEQRLLSPLRGLLGQVDSAQIDRIRDLVSELAAPVVWYRGQEIDPTRIDDVVSDGQVTVTAKINQLRSLDPDPLVSLAFARYQTLVQYADDVAARQESYSQLVKEIGNTKDRIRRLQSAYLRIVGRWAESLGQAMMYASVPGRARGFERVQKRLERGRKSTERRLVRAGIKELNLQEELSFAEVSEIGYATSLILNSQADLYPITVPVPTLESRNYSIKAPDDEPTKKKNRIGEWLSEGKNLAKVAVGVLGLAVGVGATYLPGALPDISRALSGPEIPEFGRPSVEFYKSVPAFMWPFGDPTGTTSASRWNEADDYASKVLSKFTTLNSAIGWLTQSGELDTIVRLLDTNDVQDLRRAIDNYPELFPGLQGKSGLTQESPHWHKKNDYDRVGESGRRNLQYLMLLSEEKSWVEGWNESASIDKRDQGRVLKLMKARRAAANAAFATGMGQRMLPSMEAYRDVRRALANLHAMRPGIVSDALRIESDHVMAVLSDLIKPPLPQVGRFVSQGWLDREVTSAMGLVDREPGGYYKGQTTAIVHEGTRYTVSFNATIRPGALVDREKVLKDNLARTQAAMLLVPDAMRGRHYEFTRVRYRSETLDKLRRQIVEGYQGVRNIEAVLPQKESPARLVSNIRRVLNGYVDSFDRQGLTSHLSAINYEGSISGVERSGERVKIGYRGAEIRVTRKKGGLDVYIAVSPRFREESPLEQFLTIVSINEIAGDIRNSVWGDHIQCYLDGHPRTPLFWQAMRLRADDIGFSTALLFYPESAAMKPYLRDRKNSMQKRISDINRYKGEVNAEPIVIQQVDYSLPIVRLKPVSRVNEPSIARLDPYRSERCHELSIHP